VHWKITDITDTTDNDALLHRTDIAMAVVRGRPALRIKQLT
jgi:hypothetical protein